MTPYFPPTHPERPYAEEQAYMEGASAALFHAGTGARERDINPYRRLPADDPRREYREAWSDGWRDHR